MADVIIVAVTYLDYLSPSLTLCGSFASVSSSWRVCRKVLTLMCSWGAFPGTACGTWWIWINKPPFLWLRLWRVMQSRIVIPRPPSMASQTMRGYLDENPKQFRAYFLALFAEKEYTQVLHGISKVDKSLRGDRTSSQFPPDRSSGGPLRSSAIICDFCGILGHTSFRCFRRMSIQRAGRGRFSPYSRALLGRASFQ